MGLLSTNELLEQLGISIGTLHAIRRDNAAFPKPVQLSKRRIAWREGDFIAWLAAQ